MKRDADRKAIGIWLECYNNLNGTDFHVDSYPDEDNRNIKSIKKHRCPMQGFVRPDNRDRAHPS
jgi:hypothetical protein